MAVNEISGFLKYKDSNGDVNLLLPITTKDNVDGLDEIENKLAEAVTYTEQSLTDAQKAQARENIGASAVDHAHRWNDLTDRPFYEEPPVTTTETVFDATVEFVDAPFVYLDVLNVTEGSECIVTWDGVDYNCTVVKNAVDGMTTYDFGNLAMIYYDGYGPSYEDNGMPFAFQVAPDFGMSIAVYNTTTVPTSCAVKIVSSSTTQVIHKLDNKFIDIDTEWLANRTEADMTILEETEFTAEPFNSFYISDIEMNNRVTGKPIDVLVTFDGVEYDCESKSGYNNQSDSYNIYIGIDLITYEPTGEYPFGLMIWDETVTVVLPSDSENLTHTIGIKGKFAVANDIPLEYIPDNLVKYNPNVTGGKRIGSIVIRDNDNLICIPNPDTSLTKSGEYADSKAVGDALAKKLSIDSSQTLTDEQKQQTRNNIDAASTTDVEAAHITASVAMPGSLKWDGIIGDKECVVFTDEDSYRQCFVRISDEVPAIVEDDVCFVTVYTEGVHRSLNIESDMITIVDDNCTIVGEMIIIGQDNYTFDGVTFPKKGIYAIYAEYDGVPMAYMSGLSMMSHKFKSSTSSADKYFETNTTITEVGDTLTWDGNTDGLVCTNTIEPMSGSYMACYKMSDCVPTIADFTSGCIVSIFNGFTGETITTNLSNEEIQSKFRDDGCILLGSSLVVPYSNCEYDGLTCPEPGIYFMYQFNNSSSAYVSSLTIPGYNFTKSTKAEVIKTEHLPQALQFGEEVKRVAGDTLTWDGNTDGLEHVTLGYKVSDSVPTVDDFANGASISATMPGYDDIYASDLKVVNEETDGFVVYSSSANISFTVVRNAVVDDEDGLIEPGIWYPNKFAGAKISLTIPGYTGFVTEQSVITPINPKYLPKTKWSDVQNKPFTTVGSDTLTWDGNTEGLTNIEGTHYKIGEYTILPDDVANGVTVINSGVATTYTTDDFSYVGEDAVIGPNGFFMAYNNDVTEGELTVEKGVYFMYYPDANMAVTSLTIPGYTGFTTDKIKPSALPDGLGSTTTRLSNVDLNTIATNGWYSYTADTGISNCPVATASTLFVETYHNNDRCTQTVKLQNGSNTTITRQLYDGSWGEWEYTNPPMKFNNEYRTTERWDGKPVYQYLLKMTDIPAGTTSSNGVKQVPMTSGMWTTITDMQVTWVRPSLTTGGNTLFVNGALGGFAYVASNNVCVKTYDNISDATVYVHLKYVK